MISTHVPLGEAIASERAGFANLIVEEQWVRHTEFTGRYGKGGRDRCVQDVTYNLSYLSSAISADSPALFASYVDWVKALFEGLRIPTGELAESLAITGELLKQRFPEDGSVIQRFIDLGLHQLAGSSKAIPSSFDEAQPLSSLGHRYLAPVRNGERAAGSHLILDAVAEGTSVKDIYLDVFEPSQRELGRLWQMNQMSIAQEHYCTAVTQLIMSQLYSHIFNTPKNGRRLVATCVGTELREIGLGMVADFFEMDGWDTYFLGSSTPAGSVVQTVAERNADVLAISATMTWRR